MVLLHGDTLQPRDVAFAHVCQERNPQEMRIQNEDGPAEGQWSWLEIYCRFFMSYMSNGFYKAIIVYTLPLWLSRGGLTDFVLNAFATVYIVDLDDVNGCEWKLMPKTEYLKHRTKTLTGEDATEDEEAEGFKGVYISQASTDATAAPAKLVRQRSSALQSHKLPMCLN